MSYLDKPEDLLQDTKQFLKTEFGAYFMSTLKEMQANAISDASSVTQLNKEWHLAKYNAFQEVLNLIKQPLEDD